MSQFLNTKTLVIVLAALGSLALQISALHTWAEAASPQFVGGTLGALVTSITALHLDKPNA